MRVQKRRLISNVLDTLVLAKHSLLNSQRAVNPDIRVPHLRRVSGPGLLEKGQETMSQSGCCCWCLGLFQAIFPLHIHFHSIIEPISNIDSFRLPLEMFFVFSHVYQEVDILIVQIRAE